MSVDSNNPVVMLCAKGIDAEMKGEYIIASDCYRQAWDIKTDDYEACIVAHYMARIQDNAGDSLHWNMEALNHARKADAEKVQVFYPSLYLNIGKAYEDLGDNTSAIAYYRLGIDCVSVLQGDRLGTITKDALMRGLGRVEGLL